MKKRIGMIVFASAVLSAGVALALDTGGRPWAVISAGLGWNGYSQLTKICDSGRAVYIYDGWAETTAMAVVPNADECQFRR